MRGMTGMEQRRRGEVDFRILGPLEVFLDGRLVRIRAQRQQVLLAMLLLAPNRTVSMNRLIEAVWQDDPPDTARNQIQICVSALRRRFAELGRGELILTQGQGYLLRVDTGQLDATRFERMVAAGREAACQGQLPAAGARLHEALQLWRGPVLDGMPRHIEAWAVRLDELRLSAVEEWTEINLELGLQHNVVSDLAALVAEHPLRERLRGYLMVALYLCGRPAEALEVYREGRRLLVAELGIEPGERLRQIQHAILSGEQGPGLGLCVRPWAGPDNNGTQVAAPRQLPADIADFTGHTDTLERLVRHLAGSSDRAANHCAAPLVMVTGRGGAGKTTLAVHVAHRVREAYPDGQLYANLLGSQQRPAAPAATLERFLRALGTPSAKIPHATEERAELFRSLLGGRRVLIVVDDAASESQLRPLLPGNPSCAVVVTSRRRLTGLSYTERAEIDVFDQDSAVRLLRRVVGAERLDAEPEAAERLAHLCGGLPLALRIAGARLAARPDWPVEFLASRLDDERARLDELVHGDLDIRASLAITYQGLSPAAQRLFRLLGSLDAARFAAWTAGALCDQPPEAVTPALDELVTVRLIDVAPGSGQLLPRYRLHDLVRVYARERLVAEEPESERAAALTRTLGAFLTFAEAAHRRMYGGDYTVPHGTGQRWRPGEAYLRRVVSDPIVWFEAERSALLSAVSQAAHAGLDELCWDLAVTAVTFFEARGYFDDWRASHRQALAVTRRRDNRRGEAVILCSLASLDILESKDDQTSPLLHALRTFEELDDPLGRSLALRNLAFFDRIQGRYTQAQRRYQRALEGFREVGDHVAEAHVLSGLAQTHLDLRQFDRAERLLHTSLALARGRGNRRVEAQALHRLGDIQLSRRRHDEAEQSFRAVRDIVVETGDRVGEANALYGLGVSHAGKEQHSAAEICLTKALRIAEEVGGCLIHSRVVLALGQLYLARGEHDAAERSALRALSAFEARKATLWQVRALDVLGETRAGAGELSDGYAAWKEACVLLDGLADDQAQELADRIRAKLS